VAQRGGSLGLYGLNGRQMGKIDFAARFGGVDHIVVH
jgi:hypothetical protein